MARPGDRFEAEVYRIREMKCVSTNIKDRYRSVSLDVKIPKHIRSYFTTVSWDLEKLGREPRVGVKVILELREPSLLHTALKRGRFQIVKVISGGGTDIVAAQVSWVPTSQATYCRLNIPRVDGIPLSVKATFSGFHRTLLKKGTWVEVTRSDRDDATKYHIVRIFEAVEPKSKNTINFDIEVATAEEFKSNVSQVKEKSMAQPNDNVRFFVDFHYYNGSENKDKMIRVLQQAFDLCYSESDSLMNINGFWVVCRPSQFARFMIFRNEQGIRNGFIDLKAHFVSENIDMYTRISQTLGVARSLVKNVLLAAGYASAPSKTRSSAQSKEVNVSNRVHQQGYSAP